MLVIAFAVFLVAVGAAFAVPGSRDAILGWFGLQGATVERVATLPEVPASTGPTDGALSLDEARSRARFDLVVPAMVGEPDEVRVTGSGDTARATLVYDGGAVLLTELRGDVEPEAVGKLAGPGTIVEEVMVDGEPGIWLEGEPHEVFYRDVNGEIIWDSLRLAGNTLLWERGNLLLRLEADVSKREALRIARSVGSR